MLNSTWFILYAAIYVKLNQIAVVGPIEAVAKRLVEFWLTQVAPVAFILLFVNYGHSTEGL